MPAAFCSSSRDRSARVPRARRSGRAGAFSLGLLVGFLLLGYTALRVLELAPHGPPPARVALDRPAQLPDRGAWHATVVAGTAGGEVRIEARLLPLHDEPALEEFRAGALRERYGLPAGGPWRLYLALAEGSATPVRVTRACVHGGPSPFAELARPGAAVDPVHALLAGAPGTLEVGRARPMVLWGELTGDAPELELELVGSVDSADPTNTDPVHATATLAREDQAEATRWYAGEAAPAPAKRSLEDEIARLQGELERERTRRAEREQAFLEFNRMLAALPAGRALGLTPDTPVPAPPSAEEQARAEAEAAARARAEQLGRSLAVLMRFEGLRGLDLLESGTLVGDPPAAMGPVVFRCLDERGALTGSVRAERLRLEASEAARTLTLVLEDGFESRAGERVPFENGVRRITLSEVDPRPWLKECPELFAVSDRTPSGPDGAWDLADVRRELNRLLGLDTRPGWYRLHSLGGVRGPLLTDVQLEELDPSGKLVRRLFADALALTLEDGSVVLELSDGASVRGNDKQPFRDGHLRVVLPGVALEPWRAAHLPGLSPPPEKPAAHEPAGR